MASKWSSVKNKLKDRDLDAEFEKFLNESLSDESVASPRRSITPLGSKTRLSSTAPPATGKKKFDLPWWATSEDDGAVTSKSEAVKKQWLKKRKSEELLGDDEVDVVDSSNIPPGVPSRQPSNPLTMSKDSLDANTSRPGTALDTIISESEPSYSEPQKSTTTDGYVSDERQDDDADNYGDDSFTDGSTSSSSQVRVTAAGSSLVVQPGLETLEEIREKDLFFSKLEKQAVGNGIDYGKLNEQLESEKRNENDEEPGNEGIEVVGLQPYHPAHSDDDLSSSQDNRRSPSHTQSENSHDNHDSESDGKSAIYNDESRPSSPIKDDVRKESDSENVEETLKRNDDHVVGEDKKQDEPVSLLSKVALMESLDSTAGINLGDRLSKLNAQLAAKESSSVKVQSSSIRMAEATNQGTSNDDQLGKTGDTTVEFAEALSNIKKLSTQSFGRSDERIEVIKDIQKTAHPIPSGGLLLDRDDIGKVKVNELNLKPVISNFSEEPKITATTAVSGFLDNSMGSTLAVTRSELNKVQTFSDVDELIATVLVDQYVKQVSNTKDSLVEDDAESLRGFSLQPISTVLEDSDSPPTDSLKSIKSIAEEKKRKLLEKSKKSQREIRTAPVAQRIANKPKTPKKRTSIPHYQKPTSASKPFQQTTKKKNQGSTKSKPPKSPPKIPQKLQRNVNNSRSSMATSAKGDPKVSEDLLASIEMLSASLQEFRHDAELTDAIMNSTVLDTSKNREAKVTHLNALQRERNLRDELRELRLQHGDLLHDYEKLQQQCATQQNEWSKMKESAALENDRRVKDLREELFVLKNKLEMSEKDRKMALDLKIRQATELSPEDVEQLQKQLQQQESLLNGYQQENERLYKELKDKNIDMKKMESKMFEQNQKLASEVGNLREQLETRPAANSSSASVTLSATKMAQLENQIKFYKSREYEHKEQILNLENEVVLLKKKLNKNEKHQTMAENEEGLLKKFEEMKTVHALELDKLNKKLKWYSENQELLDKDANALKDKREEVKELREVIDRLEKENNQLRRDKVLNQSSKNSDNTKIMDLKRQVKEMEDIIRRRHPNSLPALIYAAAAVPGENKVYDSMDAAQNKNVNVYLEKRVKTLEEELEEQNNENGKKVRAIEQKYNSMSLRYEEHVKQLEEKISEFSLRSKTSELEDELSRQKTEYEEIIENLKEKLKERQSKILLKDLEIEKIKGAGSNKLQYSQIGKKEMNKLKTRIKSKDVELEEMRSTLYVLQRERENLLAGDGLNGNRLKRDSTRLIDHATSPVGKTESDDRCLQLEKDNQRLRTRLEEFQLETKERIIRLEASEACALNEKRKLDEELRERLKLTEETNAREMETMKMQFAIEHSNSKVAELNGKIKSYELMVEHLKERLDELKGDHERLNESKVIEETLRKEIVQLQDEIHEARKHFTPEMHHYKMLEAKVASMETRHYTREQELQTLLEKARSKSAADLSYAEDKWREVLRDKDLEIMRFREELDTIIEVLRELKRQGIILPVTETTLDSITATST